MIHRFNATSIEIPADFSAETEKLILKFIWKFNWPRTAKTISKKKNKNNMGERTFLNFRTFYKAAVVEWCDTAI